MEGRYGVWRRRGLWAVIAAVWLCASAASAQLEGEFRVPPNPRELPPRWALEVHIDGIFAADTDSLCPPQVRCVYAGGGGVGASAELRWPVGLGVFANYDAWFLDSGSVFELGVQQGLSLGGRYTAANSSMVHPVIDASVGFMVYGDTFRAETVGLLLSGKVGVQFELSQYFGIFGGVGVRAFTHSRFTTERDNVQRGRGELFSQALFLQLALTIDGRPWATAEP